jgi:pseudo-rSAM protein/SPASM domain protein
VISISKLLCDPDAEGDGLRYDAAAGPSKLQIAEGRQRRPVVVWNLTRRCNLYCSHCYAGADTGAAPGELTTAEGGRLFEDLADYGVPVVLFSGGEPLVRDDLLELVGDAADLGLRPVLSTNGTLLTPERAAELRETGLAYAGVSVDGLPERNDAFRGQEGAFDAAVRGIRASLDAGVKTGLRYTITEHNVEDLEGVVDLLHDEGVDRFCFYHLDYGGRGAGIVDADLSPDRKRAAVKRLCDLTREYHERGAEIETLLVGNYADAAYLVEYARRHLGEATAERVAAYLRRNGGDPAGERVAVRRLPGEHPPHAVLAGLGPGQRPGPPVRGHLGRRVEPAAPAAPRAPRGADRPVCPLPVPGPLTGRFAAPRARRRGRLFAPDPQCYLREEEIAHTGASDAAVDAD